MCASDHCLEQFGYCPSCAAGALQINPDAPIYGSASFAGFQTSGAPEGYDECSKGDWLWRTDRSVDLLDVEGTPFNSWGENASIRASVSESFDLEQFIDFDLLALPIHEPHSLPSPEIRTSADGAIAENLQSQPPPNFISPDPPSVAMVPSSDTSTPSISSEPNVEQYPNISTPLSLEPRSSSSASPSSSGLGSDDATRDKREISSTYVVLSCPTCKERFTKEALYTRHRRHRKCTAPSSIIQCSACPKRPIFTLLKDLKRHQIRSCPARIVKESFTCSDCGLKYLREDTLERHVRETHVNKNS